jgi:uncharacterized protein YraI
LISLIKEQRKTMTRRLSRMFMVICTVALVLVGLPATVHADTGSNWTGAYYNNPTLSGSPVFNRIDPAVVFNWGPYSPGPGIGSSNWSARWVTVQYMNAGTYRFTITADDGVRVFIDGQIILDKFIAQAPTTYYVNVQVVAGNHVIQVDYFQGVGDASLSVTWEYLLSSSTAWTAQYFNNSSLSGAPAVSRYETGINYFWDFGAPAPGIVPDNFSARWTATFPFSSATYRFTLAGDDGVRLFIDNAPVIDQWRIQALTAFSIDVPLSAGLHTLRVEYFEGTERATVRFNYEVAVGPPPYPGTTSEQWYGEYFANTNLQGSPNFTRLDGVSGINFNWSTQPPTAGFPRTNFSVRWTRRVFFPGRPYQFYLTVDDGARLYVDSTLLIDTWKTQSQNSYTKYAEITEGFHVVRLEYFQQEFDSLVRLTWDPPNSQNPPLSPSGSTQPTGGGLNGTVTRASVLNVRSGPGINYDILTRLLRSNTFTALGRNADASWLRVRLTTGFTGWLSSYYVTVDGNPFSLPLETAGPPPPPRPTGVRGKLYSGLRMRTGPGTIYPIIANLEWGMVVDIVGRSRDGQWYQIQYGGATGWVYAPYVSIVSGVISNVPVTA